MRNKKFERIKMKTYLTVWFNSEGAEPTEVVQRLQGMVLSLLKGNTIMFMIGKRK